MAAKRWSRASAVIQAHLVMRPEILNPLFAETEALKGVGTALAKPLALAATVLVAASATPPPASPPATTAPGRIVSVNLCADEMVLHLADRGQIAGLSRNAADPALSAAAARASGLNIMRDSAETLLIADPDIIVAIPKRRSGAPATLGARHYKVVDARSAETYPQIVDQLRLIGAAVGHPDRAEALIATMDARLAALPPQAASRTSMH